MAQAIHCDGEGHRDALADVLVSQLDNGETTAWCFTHYVDVCRAVVATADATMAEAEATDAEAVARLEAARAARSAKGGDETDDAQGPGEVSAPDPGVTTFREAGDELEPADVGGPATGDPAPAGAESAAE